MNINFAVAFEISTVIKNATQEISAIYLGNKIIGYVSEEAATSSQEKPALIAFNNSGLLPEVDCKTCALKVIFASATGLTKDEVDIAVSDKRPSKALAFLPLLLGAIALNNTRH